MAPVKTEPDEEREALLNDDNISDNDADETAQLHVEEYPPADSRFDQPTPAPWKRAALLIFTGILFWLAFTMRGSLMKPQERKVVHAKRYSSDYKFRPAASPITTETLADGRLKIRGAAPTSMVTSTASPTPTKKAKRKTKRGKKRSKAKRSTKRT